MEKKIKLSTNQLNALARGRAIRRQNLKNHDLNQTGGNLDYFFEKLDNFWENADLSNPNSTYYPDKYDFADWNYMVESGAGFEPGMDGETAAERHEYSIFCPQPWGFILAAYKFFTTDIARIDRFWGEAHSWPIGIWADIEDSCGEEQQDGTRSLSQEEINAIALRINAYLDDDTLNTGRGGDFRYGLGLGKVNIYDYLSSNLDIDRAKVKHLLFKTIKVILEKRCEVLHDDQGFIGAEERAQAAEAAFEPHDPDRFYGPDQYGDEMPLFTGLGYARWVGNRAGHLSSELQYVWDEWSELTQWNGYEDQLWERHGREESPERWREYRRLFSEMIVMFKNIWELLIVPSMKEAIRRSHNPTQEFGIPEGITVVPAPEPTPLMISEELPIEIIAEHERKIYEQKYLDKWGEYGITKVDKKYAKTLSDWKKNYIESYRAERGSCGLPEPPEPSAVTKIKRAREREARQVLRKRSGGTAAAAEESGSSSSSSSSDDE